MSTHYRHSTEGQGVRAVLLVGYGSGLPGIGTTMIRLAARLSAAGIAPIAASAFLSGCGLSFSEALNQCIARGADEVIVQPYALVEDAPIRCDLQRLIRESREQYPHVPVRVARPFGDHIAIAKIAVQRALEADYAASHNMHSLPLMTANEQVVTRPPATLYTNSPANKNREVLQDSWRPRHLEEPTGLVLVAHGSRTPTCDWPISAAAEWIRINACYTAVHIAFTQQNSPNLATAIDQHAAQGLQSIILVPFMLQLTTQDAAYLMRVAADAHARYPDMQILIADHLNYDRQLLKVIADRVADVVSEG